MQLNNSEEIYKRIKEVTGKEDTELQESSTKIKAKYQGLLSEVGASIMLAKQLNVNLEMKSTSSILKISELTTSQDGVSLYARVKFIPPARTYKAKDGTDGKVQAIYLQDDTGSTKLNLWQEKVNLVDELNLDKNSLVLIKDTYVTTYNERLELSLRHGGTVIKDPEDAPLITELKTNYKDVSVIETASDELVDTIGRIISIFPAKEFEDKEKRKRKVLNFEISDGIKSLRCVAWDPWAQEFETKFKRGDMVKLSDIRVKEGLYDLELYVNWNSNVTKNPKTTKKIPPLSELASTNKDVTDGKIESLEDGKSYNLDGLIVSVNRNKLRYFKCPECNEKIQMINNEFVCEKCNKVVEPQVNMFGSVDIDDGTGILKIVFFSEIAQRVYEIVPDTLKRDIMDEEKQQIFEQLEDKLLGKKVKVVGRAKLNNFSSQIELLVSTLDFVE